MINTGQELIQCFKNCCEKYNKLFIPDSPRQDSVADSLANFYKTDDLEIAIDNFIKSRVGPFLIFDFAIESRTFVQKAQFDKQSGDKFKAIVEETRKRMEL